MSKFGVFGARLSKSCCFAWVVGEVSWLDCVDETVRARELYTRDRPGKRRDRGEVEIALRRVACGGPDGESKNGNGVRR